jgi:hypothetical protein
MSGEKNRQEGLSKVTKSYHLEPQIAIILTFLPHPCPLLPGDCVVIVTSQKDESFVVENARLLGDRRLAEEALDLPARSRFGEGRVEPLIM